MASTAKKQPQAEPDASAPDTSRPRRMLSVEEVLKIVPVGRTTLFRMVKAATFPKQTCVSPNRRVWYEDQITTWQLTVDASQPRRRGPGRYRCVSGCSE